jgi:hypothetical protein
VRAPGDASCLFEIERKFETSPYVGPPFRPLPIVSEGVDEQEDEKRFRTRFKRPTRPQCCAPPKLGGEVTEDDRWEDARMYAPMQIDKQIISPERGGSGQPPEYPVRLVEPPPVSGQQRPGTLSVRRVNEEIDVPARIGARSAIEAPLK